MYTCEQKYECVCVCEQKYERVFHPREKEYFVLRGEFAPCLPFSIDDTKANRRIFRPQLLEDYLEEMEKSKLKNGGKRRYQKVGERENGRREDGY